MKSKRTAVSRVLPYVAAVLLFVILFLAAWNLLGAQALVVAPATEGETKVTVTTNDTLWSIAGEAHLSSDIRKSVYLIEQRNGLKNSFLKTGQTLIIPER